MSRKTRGFESLTLRHRMMQNPVVIGVFSFLGVVFFFVVIGTLIEHQVSGGWWFIKEPEAGTVRRKKKFLWKPLTINGVRRFWEKAEILQVWSAAGTMTGYDWSPSGWRYLAWGEFVEDVEIEHKFSMFGNPNGDIHLKNREGVLVVFDEKSLH